MKPENWDSLTTDEQKGEALDLFHSVRGKLVVGQALAHAVLAMSGEKYPETSNIEDMEMVGMLFEPWFSMYIRRLTYEPTTADSQPGNKP